MIFNNLFFKSLFFISVFAITYADEKVTFEQLVKRSAYFAQNVVPFPTKDNRIKNFATTSKLQKEVVENAESTRPIIHSKIVMLIADFLSFKRQHGSSVEQKLYAEMSIDEFIDRLLKKRPLVFMNSEDDFLLRSGESGFGGFETIGTENEALPLVLQDYLSYDEMQISAMLGVSTPTHFINDGNRQNKGIKGLKGTFEERGVYVGLVGSRFEKPGYMEWAHAIITPEQNTQTNGYGPNRKNNLLNVWAKFYEIDHFPTFKEASQDSRGKYLLIKPNTYICRDIYKKRMRYPAEAFLVDANDRAQKKNTKAYVHAASTGLGVWFIHAEQKIWLAEVFLEVLESRHLPYISDLHLSWAPSNVQDRQLFSQNKNHVILHITTRQVAEKLKGVNKGKLLVASYAWDGNAFPGNEYWMGHLSASGDPAAACCSTIPELQNPEINFQVSSKNLYIVE